MGFQTRELIFEGPRYRARPGKPHTLLLAAEGLGVEMWGQDTLPAWAVYWSLILSWIFLLSMPRLSCVCLRLFLGVTT